MNSPATTETYHDLLRFLSRMTQNPDTAERLTLDIAGRAGLRRKNRAELYRIAYKASLGAACKPDGDPLRRMLASLDERDRAAVLLHKFHALGCAEIGQILECSAETVAHTLIRAYKSLSVTPV